MTYSIVDVRLADGSIAKGLAESSLEIATVGNDPSPIVVDFLSPKLRHRLKNGADGEAIVKAIGVKRSERSDCLIYDFTAGLGTEAFLLAQAGFTVVAFERDPLVFALLEDGLRRWRAGEGDATESSPSNLSLEFRHGDAAMFRDLPRAFATTLDPMFEGEATQGKSLPKKEMATLRRMLKPSSDAELKALFRVARSVSESRVIVKRPNGAPDLVSIDETGRVLKPAHRLEGKTARFDIYSCR